MSRVNKTKVLLGGAMKRKNPSKAATVLQELNVISDNVLDYGCGYGFDADYFGWEKYDPHYFDDYPTKQFDTIVCNYVMNVVSSRTRQEIIENIKELLTEDGKAYLTAPRNIPVGGKYSGYQRRPQNYVTLSLNSIYCDKNIEIYELNKYDEYVDTTRNIGER